MRQPFRSFHASGLSDNDAEYRSFSVFLLHRAGVLNALAGLYSGADAAIAGSRCDRPHCRGGRQHAIKSSDIDHDVRLTDFLNREPLNFGLDAKRKSAQRLIDQSIIRDEIATGGYNRATDSDAEKMLSQIRRDRFAGSDARMRQALASYGLMEDELRDRLLWQLTVLRFIDQRFRPGVIVSAEEVRDYYDQHLAELRRSYPKDSSFGALQKTIEESMEGEKINQQFEAWLDEARKGARIVFLEEDLA